MERCVNHSHRETLVRCGSCGDPICTECMVYSPVGVRCRRCSAQPRSARVTLRGGRAAKAVVAGLLVGTVAGIGYHLLLGVLGFAVLSLVLAAGVGVVVGEAVFRASGAYRSRATAILAACCTVWAFVFPALLFSVAGSGLSWRVATLSLAAAGVLPWLSALVGAFFAWRRNR